VLAGVQGRVQSHALALADMAVHSQSGFTPDACGMVQSCMGGHPRVAADSQDKC